MLDHDQSNISSTGRPWGSSVPTHILWALSLGRTSKVLPLMSCELKQKCQGKDGRNWGSDQPNERLFYMTLISQRHCKLPHAHAICRALLLTPGDLQYTILHIFTLYRPYYLGISQQPLVLPPLVHLHAKQPSNASLILELALPGTKFWKAAQVDFWLLWSLTWYEYFWCVKYVHFWVCQHGGMA